jgi:hypothetical protein
VNKVRLGTPTVKRIDSSTVRLTLDIDVPLDPATCRAVSHAAREALRALLREDVVADEECYCRRSDRQFLASTLEAMLPDAQWALLVELEKAYGRVVTEPQGLGNAWRELILLRFAMRAVAAYDTPTPAGLDLLDATTWQRPEETPEGEDETPEAYDFLGEVWRLIVRQRKAKGTW